MIKNTDAGVCYATYTCSASFADNCTVTKLTWVYDGRYHRFITGYWYQLCAFYPVPAYRYNRTKGYHYIQSLMRPVIHRTCIADNNSKWCLYPCHHRYSLSTKFVCGRRCSIQCYNKCRYGNRLPTSGSGGTAYSLGEYRRCYCINLQHPCRYVCIEYKYVPG